MKKLVLCGAVAVALCGCEDPRYKTISDDGNKKDYIDMQSINKTDNTILHIMEIRDKNSKIHFLKQVDCKNKRLKTFNIKMYDGERLVLDTPEINRKRMEWEKPVEPGTVGYAIVSAFCEGK